MVTCTCFVQDGHSADQRADVLKTKLESFSQSAFGEPVAVNWTTVPKGNGFTASKPSSSAIVSFTARQPINQDTRVSLLNELCDLWMAETGCGLDEIVAVINDPAS